MRLTKENKEKNRRVILNAATDEFLEMGFNDTSLRVLAAKLDMTAGNFYRYYKSKDEMFNDIILPVYKNIIDSMAAYQSYVLQNKSSGRVFTELPENTLNFMAEYRRQIIILFKVARGTDFSSAREKMIREFAGKMSRFAPEKDSGNAARIIAVSMLDGILDILLRNTAKNRIKEALQTAARYYLYGLNDFVK